MKYDEKTGNFLNNYDNIVEMFQFLNENCELLEKHQDEFIKSLQASFNERKTLSPKQFKWLCVYCAKADYDLSSEYDDFNDDWREGHPLDFGDR